MTTRVLGATLRARASLLLGILLPWILGATGCSSDELVKAPAEAHPAATVFPRLEGMVYLPRADLLVDRYEVTDGDFHEFLQATAAEGPWPPAFLSHWDWETDPAHPRPTQQHTPVRFVAVADAEAYAAWAGKSVPTRAEWLDALPALARDRSPWPGVKFHEISNVLQAGLRRANPVGVFEEGLSQDGCYDLIGNVAEMAYKTGSRDLVMPMGGSFQRNGTVIEDLACETLRPTPEGLREPPVSKWDVRPIYPGERSIDVGFRCVIRGAAELLETCLDRLLELDGPAREAGIRELLAVGRGRFGSNRVVPFMEEREFQSRVIWTRPGLQVRGLLRSPVPLTDRDSHEDILVIRENQVEALAGHDGTPLWQARLPENSSAWGTLPKRDGKALFWAENTDGELSFVELPKGSRFDLPPPARGHRTGSVVLESMDDGTLVVQQGIESSEPSRWEVRLLSRAEGKVRELWIPGERMAVNPIGDRWLLVSTWQEVLLSVLLPGPFRALRAEPLQVHGLSLVDRTTWQVVASRKLVPSPRPDLGRRVRTEPFVEPSPAEGNLVMMCLGQRCLAPTGEETASAPEDAPRSVLAYDFLVLELPTLETVARSTWETQGEGMVQGSRLPLTCVALDVDGQPYVFRGRRDSVQQVPLPVGVSGPRREWWSRPAEPPFFLPRAEPYLFEVHENGAGESLQVHALSLSGDDVRLQAVPRGVENPGQVSRYVLAESGRAPWLVGVRTGGESFALDLKRGVTGWRMDLGDAASFLELARMERGETGQTLLGPPPGSRVWWRRLPDGELLGTFATRRAPMNKYALVDLTGDQTREWVVTLDDPSVLDAPGAEPAENVETVIVGLGDPAAAVGHLLKEAQRLDSAQGMASR